MTPNVMAFVAAQGSEGKVLDVGSLDVNGSPRNFYEDYVGMDMRPGPGVDIVANGREIPFANQSFDKVICLETLEHDITFWKTMEEMTRVLKPKGKLIVTVRTIGFPLHEFPADYYRFTTSALADLFRMNGFVKMYILHDEKENGVFGYAIKEAA